MVTRQPTDKLETEAGETELTASSGDRDSYFASILAKLDEMGDYAKTITNASKYLDNLISSLPAEKKVKFDKPIEEQTIAELVSNLKPLIDQKTPANGLVKVVEASEAIIRLSGETASELEKLSEYFRRPNPVRRTRMPDGTFAVKVAPEVRQRAVKRANEKIAEVSARLLEKSAQNE